MDVLQERNLMIDHIGVILWYMQLLQELFYTGNQINHLLYTGPIMFGLTNTIIAYPYKTSTLQVHYSFGNILTFIFLFQTYSIWFYKNLILYPLHLWMRQLSHMTFSYRPLERKFVLIYWMTKILQYPTSLILSLIRQLVINFHPRLSEMCGLSISMEKSLSHLKVYLMNSIAIKLRGLNKRSRSAYA